MKTKPLFWAGAAALSLFTAIAIGGADRADAQSDAEARFAGARGEATIYRDVFYRGPAVTVSRAEGNLDLSWPVRSIRIDSGTWQLCSRPSYRGNCIEVDRTTPSLVGRMPDSVVQSMRPLNPWGGGGGGGSSGGGGYYGQSLRGMAAEFYPEPQLDGSRVLACRRGSATGDCAAQTADSFCRSAGYVGSASETMQTVSRRVYLADVLCTRTGY